METPSIVFENKDFLIINKPSGLVVHPFDYSKEETLLDFLIRYTPESFTIHNEKTLQDGRTINLGGIVHKLDRDTSGVMVIAKNEKTFKELRALFTSNLVQKTYTALVEGLIQEDSFRIDAPLGRNKKDYKQTVNPKNRRGELRDAITDVHVLIRNKDTTLAELSPKTGRTHQLRAHMSSISHPIVGDIAYGSRKESNRIMLHAKKIRFTLFEEEHSFEVPLPDIFSTTII